MIKAIIFDCFGVLVTEAWLPFKQKYFAHDIDLFEEATDISKQANLGIISHQEFINGAAKLAGISPQEAQQAISRNAPNEELFAFISELKPNYKIGFLSNIAGNYLDKMFNQKQIEMFDTLELSYESGYIKPYPEAFKNMAKKMGIKPDEAVFVDDQERNVTGSIEAGMQGILYRNMDKFKAELESILKST